MSFAISPFRRRAPFSAAAVLLATALAAGASGAPATAAGPLPPGEDPRCAPAVNQPTALIADWTPEERANLQQALRSGAVAVEHLGCRLRILTQCHVGGGYAWRRTDPVEATVVLDSEQALFDRVPLSVATLREDRQRAGQLWLITQTAGELRLQQGMPAALPPEGECQYATHLITAVSIGASAVMVPGGQKIRAVGDVKTCGQATESGPHPSCAVPLQVTLAPVPGRGPEEPPPGMAQVDIVSAFEDQTWDVYMGEDHVCTTPCTQWLDPSRPLYLESRGRRRTQLWLPDLGPEAQQARGALLVATGRHEGKFVNGVVFTTFGGMGVVTAITLTAVGCSNLQERGGLCTAGLITGAVSVPVTALAIWLLVDSNPKAEVFPMYRSPPRGGQPPVTVGMGPTGIAGTF